MADLGKAYVQIIPSAKGIETNIANAIGAGVDKAEKSSGGIGSALSKGAAAGLKATGAAVAAASTAVVAFGKKATMAGMSFDSSMSQVEATMADGAHKMIEYNGQTMDSMDALRDFAQKMGSTTAFSASQAADALNYMALAGYDATTSMDMLPNVLNLAAAGGMDLASASDMVTDASSALGLSIDEAAKLVDQMAVTSSKSNTSVAQLGNAMLAIGATGQMMAGGTTELSAALGILADNGTKGAEGGTRLRNILLSLGAPTDTAAKMLDSLGVSAYDSDGNMRALQDTLADLNSAMDGMTTAEKTDVINTIFNKADLGDVNYLLGVSSERWNELSSAIDNSKDAASNMANVQLDNLQGDVTLFQSALEGAYIAISDSLTPSLREFVQFGSSALGELTAAFQEGGLSGVMEALGNILNDALMMLIESLPRVIDAGVQLLNALLQGISDNLDTIIDAAIKIIDSLSAFILENLPLLINVAIQILVKLCNEITNMIPTLIPVAVDIMMMVIDTLIDNLPMLIMAALEMIEALATGLVEQMPRIFASTLQIIKSITSTIVSNLPQILASAVRIMMTLAAGIVNNIQMIIASVPGIISAIVSGIMDGISKIREVGGQLVNGLWNGISDKVGWVKDQIMGMGSSIISTIKGVFGIHSPSREFAWIGQMLDEGLAEGISGNVGLVDDAMDDVYSSVNSPIGEMTASAAFNSGVASDVAETRSAGGDNALDILADIRAGIEALRAMDIVLDTGAMVGGLARPMDKQLGIIAAQKARA